jgi:hypothetical protein
VTEAEIHDKVIAHDATLKQMHERLGSIETRLTVIKMRLDSRASNGLVGGGIAWLSLWMAILTWLGSGGGR